MGTIAAKLQKLIDTKNAIKAAIIAKGQSIADTDTFASYAEKIAAIETGVDTSDATATASDIADGVTAYVNGEKVTGSLNTISGKWHYFSNPQINAGSETSADFQFYSEIDEDILLRTWSRPAMSILRRDFGDATASDVVSGKTFTSTAGLKVTGAVNAPSAYTTIVDSGDPTYNSSTSRIFANYDFTEPTLFYAGRKIAIGMDASVFGDATAADVASGKTFTSAAGLKVTGTMDSGARKQANIAVYNEATTRIIIFYVNDGVSTRISLASGSPTRITPDQGSYFVIYGLTKQIQPQTESGPTMIYDDGNAHYHVPDGLTNGTVWVENFS